MAETEEAYLTYAGIDPSSSASGMVLVNVLQREVDGYYDMRRVSIVAAHTVTPSGSKFKSDAENDVVMFTKAAAVLKLWAPDIIVLEEPRDVSGVWRNNQKLESRGTAFGIGKGYGMMLAACSLASDPAPSMFSYGTKGNKASKSHKAFKGWMPKVKTGNLTHTIAKPQLDEAMTHLVTLADGGEAVTTEHERMALGVLLFHVFGGPLPVEALDSVRQTHTTRLLGTHTTPLLPTARRKA